jgi:signal transduction histidine kinase
MTDGHETQSGSLSAFRAAALRRSVLLAWIVVIVLTGQAVRRDVVTNGRFIFTMGAFILLLSVATAFDWRELLQRKSGPILAWIWSAAITVTLGLVASVPGLFDTALPIFSGIVVLTGLILNTVRHAVVSVLAVGALAAAALQAGEIDAVDQVLIPALTVGVVAAATALIGIEFDRATKRNLDRLADLRAQRRDFERLYAVSATLASAESLAEGLPQMVGTICRYLDAQVGVVFLYQSDDHSLQVMSPMWVNGHTLDVERLKVRVSGGGVVSQVFRSGRTLRLDRVTDNPDQYGVIGELGLSTALIAPLRVEGYNVGVIAVADPNTGSFRDEQTEDLLSLAAPAALVLSQLGRYEAAAEMTRRMQEIAQMKTDFVSVVSHELRTPLTSIIGSLDTVQRPGISGDATADLIESARRQAGRLQRLIDDLLMASRIDRNAVPVSSERIDVDDFLHDIAATVQGVEHIAVSIDPPHLTITADPDHLRRVFINLVENAGKYAPGSPVEIVARAIKTRVEIDVIDHGEGIPPEAQQTIFDPFTQLERSDIRTRGGTGLGLSIVKGLVEAMSGQVGVSDTPGGGATFTVSLPPASVDLEVTARVG